MNGQTGIKKDKQTNMWTDRPDRQTYRQTDKAEGNKREIDRQTVRQNEKWMGADKQINTAGA